MSITRVDSSTTLANLVSALADTQLDAATREQRVSGHLDAFVGNDGEAETIARGHRLFNRDVQLPAHWNAMRTAVAHTLLLDLSKRSPKIASAAQIATQMDVERSTKATLDALSNQINSIGGENADFMQLLQQLSADTMAAVCITEFMTFYYAENVSAESLGAVLQNGGLLGFRISQHLTSHLGELIQLTAQGGGALTALTAEEEAHMGRAEAFLNAINPQRLLGLQSLPAELREPMRRKALMLIADCATPEQLDALAKFYQTPAGREFSAKTDAAMALLQGSVQQQMNARLAPPGIGG